MDLQDACWPEIGDRVDVVLVPTGSCEQHGPHLPLHTDATIATEVARRVTTRLHAEGIHAVIAPTLPYGASGEHQHFPGTIDIGHDALGRVLLEIGRSVTCWADRMVFVNGHGGNLPTIIDAVTTLRAEGRSASWFACDVPGGDAHAGHTETSIMTSIAPETVRSDLACRGATEPLTELMPALWKGGVIAVSSSGVLGDATTATRRDGERIMGTLIDRATASIAVFVHHSNACRV